MVNENKNTFHRYKYISTNLENKKEKKFTLTNISKKNIYNKEEHIDKFKNINKIRIKKLPSAKINKYERNQLFEMPGDANTKDILYHVKEEIEGEYKNIKGNMNKNKDNCKNVKNNFRLKILSEEHLVKNYLNNYNLLEITNKRQALD